MSIQYTNFDLKLDGYAFTAEGVEQFNVNVTHQWGQLQGGAIPVQLDSDVRKRVASLDRGELDAKQIQAFGQMLGGYLFGGKVRDELEVCARRCKQDDATETGIKHRLRIRLWISHPPLASLPWEFAWVGRTDNVQEGFVAQNELFSLVRFETLGQPITALAPADSEHLRMVAVFSNPAKSEPLPGMAKEREKIKAGIPTYWPKMQLDIVPEAANNARVTPGDLNAVVQGDVHIFHFSGHGEFAIKGLGSAHLSSPGLGEIVLDKGDGNIFPYSAKDLANLLQGRGVRLAFLNACNVSKRDSTHYFTGIAPALQDAGVPAIIGMQFKVRDDNAEVFCEVFYRMLAQTGSVDRAVFEARKQVYANNQTASETRPHRDWGTPVLYLRAEGEQLFGGTSKPVIEPTAKPRKLKALPSKVNVSLRNALMAIETDGSLATAFTTPELVGFASGLPQAGSVQNRVAALISYLLPKTYQGQPVLIYLLQVLNDNKEDDPDTQAVLQQLIDELNRLTMPL